MSLLNELLSFPQLVSTYKNNYKVQRAFMAKSIEPMMAEAMKTNDGSLSEKDLEKIRKYYGIAVPAILGEGYAILRGKPLTDTEREIQTYLGGLTGLFDDLFDEKKIEGERLMEMIQNPKESQAQSSFELLFLKFYMRALELGNPEPIINLLVKGFHAQVGSEEQVNDTITRERIVEVTREKGGVFIQFYRAGFEGEPSHEENKMLYNLGGVGQLENDIFDIYKDDQDGIKTLSTTHSSIQELKDTYEDWIQMYETSLEGLQVDPETKIKFRSFTRILYLRGKVCLQQYADLETRMGGRLNVAKCQRESLICDMGKTKNQLKLLIQFLKS